MAELMKCYFNFNPFSPLTHSHRNLLGLENIDYNRLLAMNVGMERLLVLYDENRTLSLNAGD